MHFLYTRLSLSFSPYIWHLLRFRQLERVYNFVLKVMQETEAFFVFCIGDEDCFCLRKSWLASHTESQAESKAEIPLIVKEL